MSLPARNRRRALALGGLLLACDTRATGTTPPTDSDTAAADGPVATVEAMQAFVVARGEGDTEDHAYAQARLALAEALFGDARWLEVAPVEVHERDRDPEQVQRDADGRVIVDLGLDRARAAAVMSAFENTEPEVEAPAPWREAIASHVRAHVAAQACARRKALFSASCEPGDTSEVDAAIDDIARDVALSSPLQGGVPVDASGLAPHAPSIVAHWRGRPLAGIPLRVGDTIVRSDAQGRVTVPVGDGPFTKTEVALATDALLGPRADDWPSPRLELAPRPRSRTRWGLVVVGPDPADEPLDEALDSALAPHHFPAAVEVPPPHDAVVSAAPVGRPVAALPKVADALGGRVDLFVRLQYECAFASRMGGNRVWFEASGTLTVYDAWSGAVLVHEPIRAKANGISDARADRAARDALAQRVAQRLATAEEIAL